MSDNAKTWPIVEVNDPSGKRGLHVIWFAVNPDDYWFAAHCAKIPHGAFSEMARNLKRERQFLPHEPNLAIMDQRGGAFTIDMESQETWFDGFHKLGIHYTPSVAAAKELSVGIAMLNEWLRPTYNPTLDKFIPKLRICRGVVNRMKENPLWALTGFLWDPEQTKSWHYKQKTKDFVDCFIMLASYPNLSYRRLATPQTGLSPSAAGGLASSYRRSQHQQVSPRAGLKHITWRPRPARFS